MPHRQLDPEVLDVSQWEALGPEVLGKKRKRWLLDGLRQEWLFKVPREDDEVGRRGEDWAEWMAAWVAESLQLPVPTVRLADAGEESGVAIASFAVGGLGLQHGSEVMAGDTAGYDPERPGQNQAYTLPRVVEVLSTLSDLGHEPQFDNAVDQWLSYVVFDALVANTDRHHDNWGLLKDREVRILAPTFDHGTALGMQLSDPDRQRRLQQGDVPAWAARGKSRPFAGKPTLLQLAQQALDRMSPACRSETAARIDGLDVDSLAAAAGAVPRRILSEVAATFAIELLRINKGRVLDVARSAV